MTSPHRPQFAPPQTTKTPIAKALLIASVAAFVSGTAPAQWVQADLAALAAIDLTCGNGVVSAANTLPAGPMASFGTAEANIFWPDNAYAKVDWYSAIQEGGTLVGIIAGVSADPNQPAMTSSIHSAEFLVELSAPTPTLVDLSFERYDLLSIAAPWPEVSIDIGNDGVFEYANLPSAGWTAPQVMLTSQPTVVRLLMSSSVTSTATDQANATTRLELLVRPNNELQVTQTANGCVPGTSWLEHMPIFAGRGLWLGALNPTLFVVGGSAQPSLWTPQSPVPFATTCLLMPAPDILLWEPSGVLRIELPAALRPLSFHVQGVSPSASGFYATDAVQVDAQ